MLEVSRYLKIFLKQNNFEHSGFWCFSQSGKIDYKSKLEARKTNCVYIWLARKNEKMIPLYFGKARKGVSARMKQHLGGFREDKNGSVSGRRKRKILEILLDSKWAIEVYSRESLTTKSMQGELFDFNTPIGKKINQPSVSLYSLEEEMLTYFFTDIFPQVWLMNGLKDKDADPVKFLQQLETL